MRDCPAFLPESAVLSNRLVACIDFNHIGKSRVMGRFANWILSLTEGAIILLDLVQ